MANTLLTTSAVTNEALMVLENSLAFASAVDRQYSDQFAVEGAKKGYSINVRKPPKYAGRSGAAAVIEAVTETQVAVTLSEQYGVDLEVTTADLTTSIDDFSKRILVPAVARIANHIDYVGLQQYKQVNQAVGTAGTTPNALLTYLLAGVPLDNAGALQGDRHIIMSPLMQATIVDALKGLFQSSQKIAEQYNTGVMGVAAGFTWHMDQNVAFHVVGVQGGTPLVNGASQTGSSLITDGWTAAAATRLKQGDVFTIGTGATGVYQVTNQERQATNTLQQFVVTADAASDGSGNMTISIYPPIVAAGPQQTVNVTPADNAAITVVGAASTTTPQGLAFQKNAFTLAMADLYVPKGLDMAGRMSSKQAGLSIRFLRDFVPLTDQLVTRLDVLYGWAALRPELACRIYA